MGSAGPVGAPGLHGKSQDILQSKNRLEFRNLSDWWTAHLVPEGGNKHRST